MVRARSLAPRALRFGCAVSVCVGANINGATRSLSPPTSFALSRNLSDLSLPRSVSLSSPPSLTYARKERYAIPAGPVTVHSHTANTPAPRDLTCGRLALVIGEGKGEGGEDTWEDGRPIGRWVTPDTANRVARDHRFTLEHPRLPLRPVASISTPRRSVA